MSIRHECKHVGRVIIYLPFLQYLFLERNTGHKSKEIGNRNIDVPILASVATCRSLLSTGGRGCSRLPWSLVTQSRAVRVGGGGKG